MEAITLERDEIIITRLATDKSSNNTIHSGLPSSTKYVIESSEGLDLNPILSSQTLEIVDILYPPTSKQTILISPI